MQVAPDLLRESGDPFDRFWGRLLDGLSPLKEARFPAIKTLDQIVWKSFQCISRPKIMELSRYEYLEKSDRKGIKSGKKIENGEFLLKWGF